MKPEQTKTLKERLEALAAFLPIFDAPGCSFGEWIKPEQKQRIFTLPYFSFSVKSEVVCKFPPADLALMPLAS